MSQMDVRHIITEAVIGALNVTIFNFAETIFMW